MQSRAEEQDYQIRTIKDRFNQELTNILSDYVGMMDKINVELRNQRRIADQEIKNDFERKYKQANEKIPESTELPTINETVFKNELKSMTDYVRKLEISINNHTKFFTEFNMKMIGEKVRDLREQHRQNLKKHDEEAKKKILLLKEQNKKKFESLENTFNRSVVDLKRKFFLTSTQRENQAEFLEIRNNLSNILYTLGTYKNDLDLIKEKFRMQINSYRSKVEHLLSLHKLNYDKKKEILNKEQQEYEDELNRFDKMKEAIMQLQISEKIRIDEHIQVIQNKLNRLLDEFKLEYDKKQKFYMSDVALTNDEFEDFRQSLEKEEIEIQSANNDKEHVLTKNYKELKEAFDLKQKDYFNQRNDIYQELESKLNSYLDEIETTEEYHQKEKQKLIDDFNNIIQVLTEYENMEEIIRKTKEMLKEDEKMKENEFLLDKNNLMKEYEIIKEKEKKDFENSIIDVQSKRISSIQIVKQKHENEISELMKKKEEMIHSYLEEIRQAFENEDVKEQIEKEFKEKYQSMSKTLNGISPPISNNSKESIECLNEVQSQYEEKKKLIDDERQALLNELGKQRIYEEENHNNRLNLINSNNIESFELIKSSAGENISTLKAKIEDLKSELNDLEQFVVEYSNEIPEDEEITILQKKYENLELKSSNQVKMEEEKKIEEINLNMSINVHTEEQNKEEYEINKNKYQQNLIELEKQVSKLHENQIELNLKYQNQFEEENIRFKVEKDKYSDESILKMKNEISRTRESITSGSIWNSKEQEENFYKLDEQYKQVIQDNRKSISVLKETLKNSKEDIEVKLAEARSQKKTAKYKYKNRRSRDEDVALINHLEDYLDQKNKELTVLVQELIIYRKRMIMQEDVYNHRFGNAPSVAVLKTSTGTKLSKQISSTKSLPPLETE